MNTPSHHLIPSSKGIVFAFRLPDTRAQIEGGGGGGGSDDLFRIYLGDNKP